MNYFNFKNALIKKSVVEDGYKYTVTVDGKDIAAGSIQGLVNVLNELYRMPKTDILNEIFGDDFSYNKMNPISYSAKIKCAIDIDKNNSYAPTSSGYFCITALVTEDGKGGATSIKLTHSGTNATTTMPNIQYSFDQEEWIDWGDGSTDILLEAEQSVYFRGDNHNGISHSDANTTKFSKGGNTDGAHGGLRWKISGNINTLLSPDGNVDALPPFAFTTLFKLNSAAYDASELELPATILSQSCYSGLFQNCTSLYYAVKKLPATVLAPACYKAMYYTTQISEVPFDYLPATELASECYRNMFGVNNLTVAPLLPAKVLAPNCYNAMFYKSEVTSLTIEFTDNSAEGCTTNWLNSCPESAGGVGGTIYNRGGATLEQDSPNGVPTGWTEVK